MDTKLVEKFNKESELIKFAENVSNEDKLFLYAHYKQSTIGNNNKEKPSMFNIIDSAKWNTWTNINGMDTETAMKLYINKVKELLQKKN